VLAAHELIVDNFAGGGGASEGIHIALGRSPDIAVNHNAEAMCVHEANHPTTLHLCGNVWDVDPINVCGGRPVGLAWFSPDCKHFSKAKGGKPVEKGIRGLAWVVVRWAKTVRPRVIVLENVEEFQTWGPLTDDDRPDPDRKGSTFRRWLGELRAAGYVVEWRELRACDYGAPTTRKRLFLVARSDGQPIVWPEPTHGPGRVPYRTAAECIDWTIPVPSIFDRERPLADKTLARVARGIGKYVLGSSMPYVVGNVAPTLIQTGYGERPGQAPRSLDLGAPLGTVVAGGAKHALVCCFLAKHYGGHEGTGSPLTKSFDTVTCIDHHALVSVAIETLNPARRRGQVRAFLTKYYGTSTGQALSEPMGTVTTHDRFGLVTVNSVGYEIVDIGMRMLQPRELFRAQGFDDIYKIDPLYRGKPLTKSAQTRMCGNSVSPKVAKAIIAANFAERLAVAA
jgi:DNA (cytosine-5)-methyltransferase 1